MEIDLEVKANAMLAEFATQRNAALDRCAVLAAEVAELERKLKALMSGSQEKKSG